MKKLIPFAAIALLMASCSSDKGSVTIQLPADFSENSLVVSHMTIDNIFNAKQAEDLKVIYDTLEVKNGVATLKLDKAGAARYSIEPPVMARMQPEFYATPNESLDVKIVSFEPLDYDVKGTKLMEDIMAITTVTQGIQNEYMDLVTKNPDVTPEKMKE